MLIESEQAQETHPAYAPDLLIGVGYILAGVPNPTLFTVLTVAFAMLPFGAWVVFSIAAAALLLSGGSGAAAAALFGWGVIVMLCGDRQTVSSNAMMTGPKNNPIRPKLARPPINAHEKGKRAAAPTSVGQTKPPPRELKNNRR
ncbi:hypothetical protein [Rhodoplanes sp. Z2-YC6860]|uniref:hypothetical protein n=1 Tax=Rhodoplanes sp. Z2-YC6860 TaxID=674703 RepID=UPI00078E4C3D|nr:hypothetical protein [Rhodoplanes sp. Z2-YC6860]AMN43675.1 permease [Rhodoplanes sp. Z2-YC6860]